MSSELTDSERQSPLWAKLKKHLEAQIEASRIELEKVNKPPNTVSDDVLKGNIMAYRKLLAKGKEPVGNADIEY